MSKKSHTHHPIVENIREIIFGIEDGLVSTLGAVTGIAAGAGSTAIVILSGLVLIAVESLSMAAGSYLSSKSDAEAQAALGNKKTAHVLPVRAALVMGVFYIIGGFVPLTPYFFFPVHDAFAPSIIATIIVLYLVGVWSAKYTKRNKVKSGLEMAGVSIAAAIIGFIIGRIASSYLGIEVF